MNSLRNISRLLSAAIVLLAAATASFASATVTIYDSSSGPLIGSGDPNYLTYAERFTAEQTGVATAIHGYFGGSGTIDLEIRADQSNEPGTLLAAGSGTITAMGWLQVDLTTTATLTVGTKYWYVMKAPAPGTANIHTNIPGDIWAISTDGGQNWSIMGGFKWLFYVTGTEANLPPSASSMSASVNRNEVLEFYAPGVLMNALDPEDDPLTAVVVSEPAHGVLVLNADGSFTYTPNSGYVGPDSFEFAAFDGQNYSETCTFSIDVVQTNNPPVAAPLSFMTDEDTGLAVGVPGVLLNCSDPDGDSLSAILASGPSHGSLVLNADGSFTYIPEADFQGDDEFTFVAFDGQEQSDVAVVHIIVVAVNDAPTGADATFTLGEDDVLTVASDTLMALCSDNDGDALQLVLSRATTHGTLAFNADGTFSYMPAPDFFGTDSFEFMVDDGTAQSGPYTVTLQVMPVNDAPVATGLNLIGLEDNKLDIPLAHILAACSDVEGDALTLTIVAPPQHGNLLMDADGNLLYIPDADYNGYDSFSYEVSDGAATSNVATVVIRLDEINDAPSFVGGGDVRVDEDSGAHEIAWAGEIAAGPADEAWQSLRFTVDCTATSPLFAVAPTIDASGRLRFELLPDAWGTADVFVTLHDDGGAAMPGDMDHSPMVHFRIFVIAQNDAPSFVAGGMVTVMEDCGIVNVQWATEISGGASDGDENLSFAVRVVENAALFAVAPTIDRNGVLHFVPAADAHGTAQVAVTLWEVSLNIAEEEGALCSITQTFIIDVLSVNDAPRFEPRSIGVRGAAAVEYAGWATGMDAGAANEVDQALAFQVLDIDNPGLFEELPTVDAQGTLRFKPAKGVRGVASIMLRLVDAGGTANGGENASAIKTFSIEVLGETGHEREIAGGSCSTGASAGWLWLLVPLFAVAALRRRAHA